MSPRISLLASLTLTAATLAPMSVALAADVDPQALHAENCTSCHGSEVYTREDRKVNSLRALDTQVRMCRDNLGLSWFDEEVDGVVALLNEQYYKLGD